MTQRYLLAVLISAALLLPGQAASAADDEMLRAFSEAARTLPPAPAAKPQPQAKPAAKTVSKAEKQLQEKNIATLQQALKAENEKALAAVQAESKKQLSAQQADSDKKLAALDSEKQQQAQNLAQLTWELEAAKQQPTAAPKLSAPKSDAERDGYTLGQFIVSNAVVQLQMVKDIGLSISMDQLIAGLTIQLQSGDSLLGGEEMARRYATMQASIGKGLNALIEKRYAQLDKKVAKRKALKKDLGMQWFAVKSVRGKLLPDQQVAVNVRVITLSGKVINDFSHDQVPFNNSLPPLLQEGMSLTGKGGAVEGWALAKYIYEREPLPPWVAPYDVIHYQLAIK